MDPDIEPVLNWQWAAIGSVTVARADGQLGGPCD